MPTLQVAANRQTTQIPFKNFFTHPGWINFHFIIYKKRSELVFKQDPTEQALLFPG